VLLKRSDRVRLKVISATLIVLFSFPLVLPQQRKSTKSDPCSKAMTQAGLQSCYCDRAQKADAQLNDVYRQLLKKNGSDTSFIEKLKISQRAWLAFRDAQLEALYPDPDPKAAYGSVFTMCECMAQEELTMDRVKQLRQMLQSAEGDVCAH
jgi:uncharacterized protein YecT (DUF1311 family)